MGKGLNLNRFSSTLDLNENTHILKNLYTRNILLPARTIAFSSFQKIPDPTGFLVHHVQRCQFGIHEKLWS